MFDIGGLELLVLAVILIVVVGPKELPGMLRVFGRTMAKVRGMAAEFRGQFDEALREAELDEVRKTVADVGKGVNTGVNKLNPKTAMREAMQPFKDAQDGLKRDLEANATVDLDGPPRFDASDLDVGPEMEPAASEGGTKRPVGGAPPMEAPVTLTDDASGTNDKVNDEAPEGEPQGAPAGQ